MFMGMLESNTNEGNMELVKATMEDFDKLRLAYIDVINRTEDVMETTRWVYGQHPTDDMLRAYIEAGYMYIYKDNQRIVAMMAITPSKDDVYHEIDWKQDLADADVSVVHILAVTPDYQGCGTGNVMVELAIDIAVRNHSKSLRLDVLAANRPAQALYKKHGFEYRGKKYLQAQNTGWTDFFFFERDI